MVWKGLSPTKNCPQENQEMNQITLFAQLTKNQTGRQLASFSSQMQQLIPNFYFSKGFPLVQEIKEKTDVPM